MSESTLCYTDVEKLDNGGLKGSGKIYFNRGDNCKDSSCLEQYDKLYEMIYDTPGDIRYEIISSSAEARKRLKAQYILAKDEIIRLINDTNDELLALVDKLYEHISQIFPYANYLKLAEERLEERKKYHLDIYIHRCGEIRISDSSRLDKSEIFLQRFSRLSSAITNTSNNPRNKGGDLAGYLSETSMALVEFLNEKHTQKLELLDEIEKQANSYDSSANPMYRLKEQQGKGKRTDKKLIQNKDDIKEMKKNGATNRAIGDKYSVSESTIRRFLKSEHCADED